MDPSAYYTVGENKILYYGLKESIFDLEPDAPTEGSEIVNFFTGKHVFVTGATGFMGKALVEKLLRACPALEGIFVLVRAKKGKDLHTRLDEIYNDVFFERLSKKVPKFRHQITPIEGDMSLPGLGISESDRQLITDKVSVIFHGAATVRFDEYIKTAVAINVKGAMEMLNLAKDCKNLESYVHVSTAFSNCPHNVIEERIYEPPFKTQEIIDIVDSVPKDILERITPDLIGDWPNTYAFTKAISEHTVQENGQGLPLCIFRPSMIIPTYREPLRGWIDNIYGPTGAMFGAGTGVLRILQTNSGNNADMVPIDLAVNALINASFETAKQKRTDLSIYNYISSTQNPITWQEYSNYNFKYGLPVTPIRCIWYPFVLFVKNLYVFYFLAFFLHTIPGYLMDLVFVLMGKKPQLTKIYKKINKFAILINYFSTTQWVFKNENTQRLWESANSVDKALFPFSIRDLNWDKYMQTHGMGMRTYLLKDDPSTIPEARKKLKRLYFLHCAVKIIGSLVLLRLFYSIICFILFLIGV